MNILMVLTSHDKLGDTGLKTGFWLEEFASPFYVFKDKGFDITLTSPLGGQPPLDPKSDEPDFQTEATARFSKDPEAQALLANTTRLSAINAADYDAVFYPGGHGPLWDLAEDKHSIVLIEQFYQANKPLGSYVMRLLHCCTLKPVMASHWSAASVLPVSATLKKKPCNSLMSCHFWLKTCCRKMVAIMSKVMTGQALLSQMAI